VAVPLVELALVEPGRLGLSVLELQVVELTVVEFAVMERSGVGVSVVEFAVLELSVVEHDSLSSQTAGNHPGGAQ
jgi:hypothetical protein